MSNNIFNIHPPRVTSRNHLEALGSLENQLPIYSKTPLLYQLDNDLGTLYTQPITSVLKAPGRHVIINTRNNKVINVVKDKFNLKFQPIDGVNIIENMLINSGLDLTGMTREYSEAYDGGRYAVTYTLPAHQIDLGNGDVSALQLAHRNAGDGSWPFTLEACAVRMICMNKQVALDYFSLFKTKHTPNMSPQHGARKIAAVLKGFERERERWTAWKQEAISDMAAFRIFAKAAKFEVDDQMSLHEILSSKSYSMSKAMKYMWQRYIKNEKRDLGSNEWAAYNAMTHWATHAPASTKTTAKNIVSIKVDRGIQVRSACQLLKAA